MELRLGYAPSANQLNVKILNLDNQQITDQRIDLENIKNSELNMLLYTESEQVDHYVKDENKYYPVMSSAQLNTDLAQFDELNFEDLLNLYESISQRWTLANNLSTIEQLPTLANYLKDLWAKDRNNFFEELWYLLKTNLSTYELNIIFHDVKNHEKEDAKPELTSASIRGSKNAQIFAGTEVEEKLLKEYDAEFTHYFKICEYDQSKNQLVICARVNISPILILAKLPELNQVQKSIVIGLFSGLQTN